MSWLSRLFGTAPPPPALAATRLVVGLGNPGPDYVGTRHNAGFMVVDRLAERLGVGLDAEAARAFVAEAQLPPDPETPQAPAPVVAVARPLTWMNRSGEAVGALLDRYGLSPAEMLLVYDDLALPLGALRIRGQGSHGGHNGIRSVIEALGSTEFPRLRVGVGNSFPSGGQVDFVLSPFDDDERDALDAALEAAADASLTFARHGLDAAMNRHNRR
ncbi:aminoacyl-tRNA hydrolase [Rubrivirga sp. IMCC43871]|uniref:aminoacyl-tRNA hydrolase n=1 Tax=Rubrivirga sp. IMCC43871 TaxID=3391575 RepID=UPI00399025E7